MAETMADLQSDSFDSDQFMDANDTVGPPKDELANTSMDEKIIEMATESELKIEAKEEVKAEAKEYIEREPKQL